MIYRCACCLLSATAKYKIAWCPIHEVYECQSCWRHAHPNATTEWGDDDGPEEDDPPRRP